ncbi:MAG: glycosyltransferase family 2 protein [Tabrizicola sp.]|nr:glycosyltransferase family 2 protein [Tabrizicola sp.]
MAKAAAKRPAKDLAGAASVSARPGPRKVLFSAVKNEAPFLLEWIAYHKVIGFDEIVICSNPSNDGTEELLAALAGAGEIRHLQVTPGPKMGPQRVASETFSRFVGYREGDWYLWLDADEFLNVKAGDRTVDALIKVLGHRQLAPVCWRIFGSGRNPRFPGRFIDPAFALASAPEFAANLEQKTLFRYSQSTRGFAMFGINRPLLAKGNSLTAEDVMVGNGGPALASFKYNQRWLSGVDFGRSAWVDPKEFGWHHAQINHYAVRTPEFFALKRLRGRGIRADAIGAANRRHTEAFFHEHDRNEVEDRSILFWQDRVTAEIARLMGLKVVADAAEQSAALVASLIKDLPEPVVPSAPAKPSKAPDPQAAEDLALKMPPAEAAHLRQAFAKASVILEYGSGGSTIVAAEGGRRVFSVESDKAWADRVQAELATISDRAHVHYADVGETGEWGAPVNGRAHRRFHAYALSVWDRPDFAEPDVVLIDGRFRAACLVAVLLRARRPTTVLFDDYRRRRFYHGVEKLARKEELIGNMARFTVTPGPIPPDMMTQAIGWFTDPR